MGDEHIKYLFPFNRIKKGSKIILFGIGDIGKEYYLQLRQLEDYYTLVAWTATSLAGYDLDKPFDYVENIPNYDFDCILISAAGTGKNREEIGRVFKGMDIPPEKLVWADGGLDPLQLFPTNRKMMLKHLDFYMELLDLQMSGKINFSFYQSFRELGIPGLRSTEERFSLYHISELLGKEDVVLDIGCNSGFLALQTAPFVQRVVGYDIDPHLIRIANRVKDFLGTENVDFICEDFFARKHGEAYDAVFAFAIHTWVVRSGISQETFVDIIYSLLKPGGYLFFESHFLKHGHEEFGFTELCESFSNRGMKTVLDTTYQSECERIVRVFQKPRL